MTSNVIEFTYKTTSMQEAAALWAQTKFRVDYVRLEPVDLKQNENSRRHLDFKFVFTVYTSQETFNQYKLDYVNRKTEIEPKRYDNVLNSLRDNLRFAKS